MKRWTFLFGIAVAGANLSCDTCPGAPTLEDLCRDYVDCEGPTGPESDPEYICGTEEPQYPDYERGDFVYWYALQFSQGCGMRYSKKVLAPEPAWSITRSLESGEVIGASVHDDVPLEECWSESMYAGTQFECDTAETVYCEKYVYEDDIGPGGSGN